MGRDWAYAGWLLEVIGALEKFPNRLPRSVLGVFRGITG